MGKNQNYWGDGGQKSKILGGGDVFPHPPGFAALRTRHETCRSGPSCVNKVLSSQVMSSILCPECTFSNYLQNFSK